MANLNEQCRSWIFKFRKVVRQQIWGEVVCFIPLSLTVYLWMRKWKIIIKIDPTMPKL